MGGMRRASIVKLSIGLVALGVAGCTKRALRYEDDADVGGLQVAFDCAKKPAGDRADACRIVADYADNHDPRREAAWIAEVDGQPVGCVLCVRKDDDTAQLRILLVDPAARGLGIGARLVGECLAFARRAGYKRIVLWTNDVLIAARRIYQAAGFRLTGEEPHHSFGHDLVSQTWQLDL